MKSDVRTDCPIADLRIGLKYEESDGFSGITVNPLLGVFTDLLNTNGESTVLTEGHEMFGPEPTLIERADDNELNHRKLDLGKLPSLKLELAHKTSIDHI